MRKRAVERDCQGIAHNVGSELLESFRQRLPFPLTGAQKRAIPEIEADLAKPVPMHRLLQGDVGAGKTLVALWCLLTAVAGGYQGALMAPTEVLAEQHHISLKAMLAGLSVPDSGSLWGEREVRVELLTNRTTASERANLLAGLAAGDVDLVVGTHALLTESVTFRPAGHGRDRRTAPLRGRTTVGAAGKSRRPGARRACDDGHARYPARPP